jgi:GT2 family glycosyltransferase
MNNEIFTFCITTFLRPAVAMECVARINRHYPGSKIIVADQPSPSPAHAGRSFSCDDENVAVLKLPFDCGASYARNRLVEAVRTPYMVLMDDDMYVSNANIWNLHYIITRAGLDICSGQLVDSAGNLQPWHGRLWIHDAVLRFEAIKIAEPFSFVDVTPNFFFARTSSFLSVPWCEDYKIGREHLDFCWNAKQAGLKTAIAPCVVASHMHFRDEEYMKYRRRPNFDAYNALLLRRLGVRAVHSVSYPKANVGVIGQEAAARNDARLCSSIS